MKMYSLPNFCRVCLKYDKNLIDLAHIENEPNETLMSKLEQCVAEVDWKAYKPLLCHPCIKKLNVAFGFKKQCVQSASVLRNYLELVRENQKKISESQNATSSELSSADLQNSPGAFMVLPNQKFVKIVVSPQQQNSFQNVFLNLIPSSGSGSGGMSPPALAPVSVNPLVTSESLSTTKDTNQNVFVNLNSTIQKFVPIAPNESTKTVNQLLTDTKTEELSVEIDPTIFGLGGTDSDTSDREEMNDWDEVITQSQIKSEITKINGDKPRKSGNYVPILPKHATDFISSGKHFLSSDACFEGETSNEDTKSTNFQCETCQKNFPNMKILKNHIKMFHMGKYPFKCTTCFAEYVTRSDYELCIKSHKTWDENSEISLTLKDFENSTNQQSASDGEIETCTSFPNEENLIECDLCKREFHSQTGLLRHKVRKHNQKNKKKYFIKGMKNAKCDICNREFSTLSYMHLHRKLHMRDEVGYKYKVLGKNKYSNDKGNGVKTKKEKIELLKTEMIDVTPDITLEREMDEDSEPEEEILKLRKKNYTKLKETRPELEITKIVRCSKNENDDDDDDDSDENALHMDLDDTFESLDVKKEEISAE